MKEQIRKFVEEHYKLVSILGLLGAVIISYFSIITSNKFPSFMGGLISSWLLIAGIYGIIAWSKKK